MHRDVLRRPREPIAAVGASRAVFAGNRRAPRVGPGAIPAAIGSVHMDVEVRPVGWRLVPGPSLATNAEIAELAASARARGRLGIDTEFMSEGRYRALLCL